MSKRPKSAAALCRIIAPLAVPGRQGPPVCLITPAPPTQRELCLTPDSPLSEIPERYEDVTVEWLETALRSTGTISPETRLSAFELEPLKLDTYRISSVARIALEYDSPLPEPGRPAAGPPALIAKFVSRDTRGRESIKDQANFQYEEQVYRQLSDRIPLRIPGIYYGAQAPDSDLGVVMIEEIRGAHVRDEAGTDRGFTVCEARLALSEIAKLHGRWWASKSLWELPWLRSWVHVNGRKRPRRLASRWESVRDLIIDVCSPTEMSLFDAMLRVFTRAFKTVESMPFTLGHGDFHSGTCSGTGCTRRVRSGSWTGRSSIEDQ